jgi:peptidoglycan hydrolase-like protein with peptidoglycan-binding domain
VTKVQEQLTVLKEYMGPITGKLDQVTVNALGAFQRSQDITPDGRFDEETLEALDEAAAARRG